MGQNYSHMNFWALSEIVFCSNNDISRILELHEINKKGAAAGTLKGDKDGSENFKEENNHFLQDKNIPFNEEQEVVEFNIADYDINEEGLGALLTAANIHPLDIEIFFHLYHLINKKGAFQTCLIDVLISFTVFTCTSLESCIIFCIEIFDRNRTHFIEKDDLLRVFTMLHEACTYTGDKMIDRFRIRDFIDSIFTSAGKIDGSIYYPNFIDLMSGHPIIEMFLSVQYQGNARSKVLSDEEIENAVFMEN